VKQFTWLLYRFTFLSERRTKVARLKKKVKLSRYTPWRHMGGEEV
jgi:hypothetical protein